MYHLFWNSVKLNIFFCKSKQINSFFLKNISREFNTRVKSISMASFKPEEIKGLQEGGNDVMKDYSFYSIY